MMEAVSTSKSLVSFYETTLRNIPDDGNAFSFFDGAFSSRNTRINRVVGKLIVNDELARDRVLRQCTVPEYSRRDGGERIIRLV
jgi:hypothetical protein